MDRLLIGAPRLPVVSRLRLTALAVAAPVAVLLLAVLPGLTALR